MNGTQMTCLQCAKSTLYSRWPCIVVEFSRRRLGVGRPTKGEENSFTPNATNSGLIVLRAVCTFRHARLPKLIVLPCGSRISRATLSVLLAYLAA